MGCLEIGIKLKRDFVSEYTKLQNEFGSYMASINGFGGRQLSYTDFIDNFIDRDTVADVSVDGNSNVSHKDIVTLEREMSKPHMKLLAFNKIYYEIEKKYGFYNANKWLRYEWIGKLYMHDADTSTKKSYCFAYDLKDLAEKGLYFIEGRNATPPRHLMTFVDFIKEFINYASNRTSGACGLPNIIPYMFYFWRKDVDNDYLGIKTSGNERYYADQAFQRFIYAVNQPYTRDGSQSAFTNTSVFDRPYFEALFGGAQFPDGSFMIDYEEEIIEFQKWYMEVMSDIRSASMFTFPVSSISLLKNSDPNCSDDEFFVDKEFAEWAIKHNMKWSDSNIFIDDTVTSLSNCCFDGKQEVLVKHGDEIILTTIKNLYDRIEEGSFKFINDYRILNNGEWVRGDIIKSDKKMMYKITTINNKQIFVTEDHLNPTQRGDIYTKDLTEEDYILFNTKALEGFSNAKYEEGYIVGVFASAKISEVDDNYYMIKLSIDKKYVETFMTYCTEIDKDIKNYDVDEIANNQSIVTFNSKTIYDLIIKYIQTPTYKDISLNCILDSIEFRKGIIDGFNTTPKNLLIMNTNMSKSIEAIYTSLGIVSKINILENFGQILCTKSNCIDDIHIVKDDKRFYRIKSITPYELSDEYTYCFNMEDKENPYFTLPNGVVTHS